MNSQPDDAQSIDPVDPFEAKISELAERLQVLNHRAAMEYAPLVETILRTGDLDVRHIEHILDGLLDFCGDGTVLTLFRRLCRHYWHIDPAATARYIQFYRESWDPDSLPQ